MGKVSLTSAVEINEITTKIIKEMMKLSESPKSVWAGIHNCFVFGEIFEEIGLDISEKQLEKLFEHIDAISSILEEVENPTM